MIRPVFLALALAFAAAAQQPQIGVNYPPLGPGPFLIDTAEQHKVKVTIAARGLSHPFGMAFLDANTILITERSGTFRIFRDGVLGPALTQTPKTLGQRGLLDVAVYPKFAEHKWIYFTYQKPGDPLPPLQPGGQPRPQGNVTLARATWTGSGLTDFQDLFVAPISTLLSGARIAFGKDGFLYMTTGATAGNDAQDLASHLGKVLRLTEDGKPAPGNPFIGRAGAKPEIYSIGHRDHLGLTIHPDTGAVLNAEHGPNGGDEVNLIQAGRNYGWPTSSFGRDYAGPRISETPLPAGVEMPLILWMPSIGPSGLTFYNGDKFPGWKGNLFVGSARWGEIPGTGSLQRVVFNAKLEEIRRESMLGELHQRIRDVRQSPDGYLYVLTDENDGMLLKLEPAQ